MKPATSPQALPSPEGNCELPAKESLVYMGIDTKNTFYSGLYCIILNFPDNPS